VTLSAFAPPGLGAGDDVLAFVRPENIEVLRDGEADGELGVVDAVIEQIVFEGPTVRLVADVDGQPIKVTVGGLERLTLIDGGERRLRLRLQEVSLVPA
jgi:hypothetical protein